MVWEGLILRKKYFLSWKCHKNARNEFERLNLIVFHIVHINRSQYSDWWISLYAIPFKPELTNSWKMADSVNDSVFQFFFKKMAVTFCCWTKHKLVHFVFSLKKNVKWKKDKWIGMPQHRWVQVWMGFESTGDFVRHRGRLHGHLQGDPRTGCQSSAIYNGQQGRR